MDPTDSVVAGLHVASPPRPTLVAEDTTPTVVSHD
jgi:hypothetical protein